MTKKEYLSQLEDYLSALSIDERQDILSEIEERFQAASEAGEKPVQVMNKLGTPEFLAQSYLKTEGKENGGTELGRKSKTGTFGKVMLVIGLLALNGFLVIWLWFSAFMVLFSFLIAGGGIMLAGLALMCSPAIGAFLPNVIIPNMPAILYFMSGLTVLLLGILGVLLTVWLLIWLVKLFVKYIKANINLVKKA